MMVSEKRRGGVGARTQRTSDQIDIIDLRKHSQVPLEHGMHSDGRVLLTPYHFPRYLQHPSMDSLQA